MPIVRAEAHDSGIRDLRALHELSKRPAVASGITVREYRPGDDIERFTRNRDLDVARDSIFVAELNGHIAGVLAIRLIPFAHSLELERSPVVRRVGDALIQYGRGYSAASGFREVMFCVEPSNAPMAAFIEERGAIPEEPATVYMMETR